MQVDTNKLRDVAGNAVPYYEDQAIVEAAADELDELRAIVAKLPKIWRLNEQGELVQDVPVTHWMTVYDWCGNEETAEMAVNEGGYEDPCTAEWGRYGATRDAALAQQQKETQ